MSHEQPTVVPYACAKQRRYYRYSIALLLIGLGAFAGAVWAPSRKDVLAQETRPSEKEIRANSFVVTDESGNARIRLSVTKNLPSIDLLDEKGTVRASLAMTEHAPYLELLDEQGQSRVSLSMHKGPLLCFTDENEVPRLRLAAFEDETWLDILDAKKRSLVLLSLKEDPYFSLRDREGTSRIGLLFVDGPAVALFDKEGEPRARLEIDDRLGPGLILGNGEKVIRSEPWPQCSPPPRGENR